MIKDPNWNIHTASAAKYVYENADMAEKIIKHWSEEANKYKDKNEQKYISFMSHALWIYLVTRGQLKGKVYKWFLEKVKDFPEIEFNQEVFKFIYKKDFSGALSFPENKELDGALSFPDNLSGALSVE